MINDKHLLLKLVLLVTIDAVMNIVVNMMRGSSLGLIKATAIIRAGSLLLFVPCISFIVLGSIGRTNKAAFWVIFLLVYLMISIVYYWLKADPEKELIKTFVTIHMNWRIYSVLYLPYIIAVPIYYLVVEKLKI